MRSYVDLSKCLGNGICNEIAPKFFAIDENGLASVEGYGLVPPELEASVEQAERSCPAHAVFIETD